MKARERGILERFLRAEAMAKYALRAVKDAVPPDVAKFIAHQEQEEEEHQRRFESVTGLRAQERETLPKVPDQWHVCAVKLLGYEALGFAFAQLALAETTGAVQDLVREVLADEATHVRFYEEELRKILDEGRGPARDARSFSAAFLRRLPKTVDRYLRGSELEDQRESILESVRERFRRLGLTPAP